MAQQFIRTLILVVVIYSSTTASAQQADDSIFNPRTVFTMSEVLDAMDIISLGVVTQASVNLQFDRENKEYLRPLTTYFEENIIAMERSATIYPQRMIDYILRRLQQGRTLNDIGPELVNEFLRLDLEALQEQQRQLSDVTASSTSGGLDDGLSELSLEALSAIRVTSVSRKSEERFQTAAAIQVITSDDIRHSGVRTLPDALRLATGLQVSRVDAHTWGISARGFNGPFANKLLVMIDGRSVYNPLYSGVFWDLYDVVLDDILRIEIIRGPGATLWGSNAVNGVINIITKNARDTQGLHFNAGGGTEYQGFSAIRYGFKSGNNTHFRVYGKFLNQDATEQQGGLGKSDDAWRVGRGGFRMDWTANSGDQIMVQGDLVRSAQNQTFRQVQLTAPYASFTPLDITATSGSLLLNWEHPFNAQSDLTVQTYFDRHKRTGWVLDTDRTTFDFDSQWRIAGSRTELIVGGGYRISSDELIAGPGVATLESKKTLHLFNFFAQNDLTVVPDRFRIIVGGKVEHNTFTQFEIQPNARLLLTPHRDHTLWGAGSRAVRIPSRAATTAQLDQFVIPPGTPPANSPLPTRVTLFGNPDFLAEAVWAIEGGYRYRFGTNFSAEAAGFYNIYTELRSVEQEAPSLATTPTPHGVQPIRFGNLFEGNAYGVEGDLFYQPIPWWGLRGSYTYFKLNLDKLPLSNDTTTKNSEGNTPQHQVALRSTWTPVPGFSLNAMGRYVDSLPALGVPDYWGLDVRLSFRPVRNLEFSVAGLDLIEDHAEFQPTFIETQRTVVQRSVYGMLTVRF